MKKVLTMVLVFSLLFALCGCSLFYEYENDAIGSFDVGYSEILKKAFLADYHWNGSEDGRNVVVPDRYQGAVITGLGGYTGRGYPSPFLIRLSDEAKMQLCPEATEWWYVTHTAESADAEVRYLRFQLQISEHIKELENLSMGGIILASYPENGEEKHRVFVLTCYVTCDEDNETFYAKDGKLYYRDGDVLVEDIVYEDFDLEAHNERNRDESGFAFMI